MPDLSAINGVYYKGSTYDMRTDQKRVFVSVLKRFCFTSNSITSFFFNYTELGETMTQSPSKDPNSFSSQNNNVRGQPPERSANTCGAHYQY